MAQLWAFRTMLVVADSSIVAVRRSAAAIGTARSAITAADANAIVRMEGGRRPVRGSGMLTSAGLQTEHGRLPPAVRLVRQLALEDPSCQKRCPHGKKFRKPRARNGAPGPIPFEA